MTKEEIREWVEQNAEALMPDVPFEPDELDHISTCMHYIYLWYHEDFPIGRFLSAVVKNDFCEAAFQADNINQKALYLYALFLANKIPLDYRMKAMGGGKLEINQKVMIRRGIPHAGEVGTYIGDEKTVIGWLHKIEFEDGSSGFFSRIDIKVLDEESVKAGD